MITRMPFALRLVPTLAMAAVALGQIPPLDWHKCVQSNDCGETSRVCWTPNHPSQQGGNNCVYCDASSSAALCQKCDTSTSCAYTGNNWPCGSKFTGTCVAPVGGTIGRCALGTNLLITCTVPRC